jgi:hypothetical protein
LPFTEVWRFQRGAADYVGIVREWDDKVKLEEEPAEIRFPIKRHVYDILRGKYHGMTDKVSLSMAPASPAFYALLREKVEAVKVKVQPQALKRSGDTPSLSLQYEINVMSDDGEPEDHALRIEVIGPDGKRRDFYAANVFAKRGRATRTIRFALNDPAGTWRITARDIVSNLRGSATFKVE